MKTSKNKLTRILVFGTFDILHPGHIQFFRQARKLAKNPFLIVSVARDINVKRIKGASPANNERKRLRKIKKNTLVNKAVLGEKEDYLGHILSLKPGILALGYDQKAYTRCLKEKLAGKGLVIPIVRLKAYKPGLHKTSLLRRK